MTRRWAILAVALSLAASAHGVYDEVVLDEVRSGVVERRLDHTGSIELPKEAFRVAADHWHDGKRSMHVGVLLETTAALDQPVRIFGGPTMSEIVLESGGLRCRMHGTAGTVEAHAALPRGVTIEPRRMVLAVLSWRFTGHLVAFLRTVDDRGRIVNAVAKSRGPYGDALDIDQPVTVAGDLPGRIYAMWLRSHRFDHLHDADALMPAGRLEARRLDLDAYLDDENFSFAGFSALRMSMLVGTRTAFALGVGPGDVVENGVLDLWSATVGTFQVGFPEPDEMHVVTGEAWVHGDPFVDSHFARGEQPFVPDADGYVEGVSMPAWRLAHGVHHDVLRVAMTANSRAVRTISVDDTSGEVQNWQAQLIELRADEVIGAVNVALVGDEPGGRARNHFFGGGWSNGAAGVIGSRQASIDGRPEAAWGRFSTGSDPGAAVYIAPRASWFAGAHEEAHTQLTDEVAMRVRVCLLGFPGAGVAFITAQEREDRDDPSPIDVGGSLGFPQTPTVATVTLDASDVVTPTELTLADDVPAGVLPGHVAHVTEGPHAGGVNEIREIVGDTIQWSRAWEGGLPGAGSVVLFGPAEPVWVEHEFAPASIAGGLRGLEIQAVGGPVVPFLVECSAIDRTGMIVGGAGMGGLSYRSQIELTFDAAPWVEAMDADLYVAFQSDAHGATYSDWADFIAARDPDAHMVWAGDMDHGPPSELHHTKLFDGSHVKHPNVRIIVDAGADQTVGTVQQQNQVSYERAARFPWAGGSMVHDRAHPSATGLRYFLALTLEKLRQAATPEPVAR